MTDEKLTEIWADGHCHPEQKCSKGYGRITDENRKELLPYFSLPDLKKVKIKVPIGEVHAIEVYSSDTPKQQINYAELVALYAALIVSLEVKTVKTIYIDSVTSNAWSEGRIPKSIKDPIKRKMCEDTSKLRKEFEKEGGKIIRISGKINKADFKA